MHSTNLHRWLHLLKLHTERMPFWIWITKYFTWGLGVRHASLTLLSHWSPAPWLWVGGIKPAVTFQGDDFAGWIHDGAVSRDGPPDGVGGVGHVHDHHLVLIADFFSDADELVRLHGEIAEPDVSRVHAHVLQLKRSRQWTNCGPMCHYHIPDFTYQKSSPLTFL